MRRFAGALAIPVVSIIFALFVMFALPFSRKHMPSLIMNRWARTVLGLMGVKVEIKGAKHIPRSDTVIYMANHATMLDIPLLAAALDVDLRFIYKKSLTWIPFVGWAIWAMGMIPVDRGNRSKALGSLKKAGRQIRKGYNVLIFPEGTRTVSGQMLPMKKGGFLLAIQEQLAIVPISIRNSQSLCGRNSILAKAGTIEIVIHPKMEMKGKSMKDRKEVMDQVQERIQSEL